ncbi:MAG: hypothetical protein IKY43_02135 [Bacteroidales bacterium]|jgi:hypothetical protein|nr:hypothetical protein [Bacteroidales bacterium]
MIKNKYFCVALSIVLFGSCFCSKKTASEYSYSEEKTVEYATWLNKEEANELNAIFAAYRNDFDFTDKRVIFFTGSSGKLRSSKEHYFKMQKKYDNTSYYNRDNGYLYIFDADEKEAIGGYDAAIVFWTKEQLPEDEVMDRIMLEPPVE